MDFYQLTYFKKVAETRSMSRASGELLLTQPAVSKQIKALEEELGEKLFDRIGKKVFLTRAGEVLYTYAEKILRSVQEAKTAVKDMSSGMFRRACHRHQRPYQPAPPSRYPQKIYISLSESGPETQMPPLRDDPRHGE